MAGESQAAQVSLASRQVGAESGPAPHHRPRSANAEESVAAERKLLDSLARGGSASFWVLWEGHRKYLYGLCLRRMNGNHADAEDALGQAMMKAWDRLPGCAREITNLRAWLARLTRNLCVDLHREQARRTRITERLEEMAETGRITEAQAFGSSRTLLLHCELEHDVRPMIEALPARLREPFVLRVFQQMSYKEIAARLALSPDNIRKRVQQARALLRRETRRCSSGEIRARTPECRPRETPAGTGRGPAPAAIHRRPKEEITARAVATRLVRVRLPSEVDMHFHIFLDKKPTRQRQKIETLRAYVQRHPGGWKKRLALADLLYETGAWQEAVDGYRRVLDKQPWLTDASVRLGNILYRMEGEREAIAVYESALPSARRAATRRHIQGLVAFCRRDEKSAAAAFQEAVFLEPDNLAHRHALAQSLWKAGRPEAAVRVIEEALRIDPNDIVVLTAGHEALLAAGHAGEAWRRVERVLELAPDDVPALKRLADHRCGTRGGEGDAGRQAKVLIRRALHLAPESAAVHESLALFHFSRGEPKDGITVLRDFAEQHPRSPCGWRHLARWLLRTGDPHAAAGAMRKARALTRNGGGRCRAEHKACELRSAAFEP